MSMRKSVFTKQRYTYDCPHLETDSKFSMSMIAYEGL